MQRSLTGCSASDIEGNRCAGLFARRLGGSGYHFLNRSTRVQKRLKLSAAIERFEL
jgi:hypothetical protein